MVWGHGVGLLALGYYGTKSNSTHYLYDIIFDVAVFELTVVWGIELSIHTANLLNVLFWIRSCTHRHHVLYHKPADVSSGIWSFTRFSIVIISRDAKLSVWHEFRLQFQVWICCYLCLNSLAHFSAHLFSAIPVRVSTCWVMCTDMRANFQLPCQGGRVSVLSESRACIRLFIRWRDERLSV